MSGAESVPVTRVPVCFLACTSNSLPSPTASGSDTDPTTGIGIALQQQRPTLYSFTLDSEFLTHAIAKQAPEGALVVEGSGGGEWGWWGTRGREAARLRCVGCQEAAAAELTTVMLKLLVLHRADKVKGLPVVSFQPFGGTTQLEGVCNAVLVQSMHVWR